MKGKSLGKGLNSLIPAENRDEYENAVLEISLNLLEPNEDQPRKDFGDEELNELAASFKEHGVIQPIIVVKEKDYYKIVAGERRWRAARIAGLKKIPCIVKDYKKSDIMQVALIENIQRKDLNPMEEAYCYDKLAAEFFYTQEQIAEKFGKSRTHIAGMMNLLKLGEKVRDKVAAEEISQPVARMLLDIDNKKLQAEVAEEIIEKDLSTREAQTLIQQVKTLSAMAKMKDKAEKAAPAAPAVKITGGLPESQLNSVQRQMQLLLGTRVVIQNNKDNKGKILIDYNNKDELYALLAVFKKLG